MRKYLLAAVAVGAIATPAAARDGQGYAGIEFGILWSKDQDADVFVDVNQAGVLSVPGGVPNTPVPADAEFNNVFGLDSKMGYNIGIYGGYDFGMFRVEGEIDWMHANLDDLELDTNIFDAIDDDTDLIDTDYDLDEATGALAFMLNGLFDFGDQDGASFQIGGGFGWAKSKLIDDKDGAFAWQIILGAQYALSPNIDLGARYKYFATGNLEFSNPDAFSFTGGRVVSVDPDGTGPLVPVNVVQTVPVTVFTDADAKFRTHSLVATLTYNFGSVEEAPPPPPPPPPAPERGV